jgi:hypothetical protein
MIYEAKEKLIPKDVLRHKLAELHNIAGEE